MISTNGDTYEPPPVFRCYYEDGTVITSDYCPLYTDAPNYSPLINSELTIIDNVVETHNFPWWLLILLGIVLLSDKKKG